MIAVAIALAGTMKNINNQQEMAEKARLSDLKAAKAVLPLALTKMVQVGRTGVDFALEQEPFYRDPRTAAKYLQNWHWYPRFLRH